MRFLKKTSSLINKNNYMFKNTNKILKGLKEPTWKSPGDFLKNAPEKEKKTLFMKAAKQANEDQRKIFKTKLNMQNKKYNVSVAYEITGSLIIKAKTKEKAIEKALKELDYNGDDNVTHTHREYDVIDCKKIIK